jgi:hypothetical protein
MYYFRGSAVFYALEHSGTEWIKYIVSHILEAHVRRVFAQAQLEEIRYRVGLAVDGLHDLSCQVVSQISLVNARVACVLAF